MTKRSLVRRKRLGGPRRGRVLDKAFLAWMHTQPCLVFARAERANASQSQVRILTMCGEWLTVHHVRFFGSPKDDRRTLALCSHHHLHMWPLSIERLGKERFQEMFHVDIEAAITDYNERYAKERAA